MLGMSSSESSFDDQRGVGANQHNKGSATSSRTSRSSFVDGNVGSNDESESAVPSAAFNPVESVKKGIGSSITSIDVVGTLNSISTGFNKNV